MSARKTRGASTGRRRRASSLRAGAAASGAGSDAPPGDASAGASSSGAAHAAVRTVVSIDVGRKNLALFAYDAARRVGTYWENVDTGLVAYDARRWRVKIESVLRAAPLGDVYLIERQVPMPENHKNLLVECIVQCVVALGLGRPAVVVRPKDVSAYFDMTRGAKYYKKRDAIAMCEQILLDPHARIRMRDERMARRFLRLRDIAKRDDLADALLQCIYWCEKNLSQSTSAASAAAAPFDPTRYKRYKPVRARRKSSSSSPRSSAAARTSRRSDGGGDGGGGPGGAGGASASTSDAAATLTSYWEATRRAGAKRKRASGRERFSTPRGGDSDSSAVAQLDVVQPRRTVCLSLDSSSSSSSSSSFLDTPTFSVSPTRVPDE